MNYRMEYCFNNSENYIKIIFTMSIDSRKTIKKNKYFFHGLHDIAFIEH